MKLYRLTADYQFEAEDVDDAMQRLSRHFADPMNSELHPWGGYLKVVEDWHPGWISEQMEAGDWFRFIQGTGRALKWHQAHHSYAGPHGRRFYCRCGRGSFSRMNWDMQITDEPPDGLRCRKTDDL